MRRKTAEKDTKEHFITVMKKVDEEQKRRLSLIQEEARVLSVRGKRVHRVD